MVQLLEKCNGKLLRREIECPRFADAFDVAVIGLGTAGAVSAIVCRENGLTTLGVEKLNAPGGTMTMGGVCCYYFGGKGGEYERIDEAVLASEDLVISNAKLNPDLRKFHLHCQLKAAGITAWYESYITGLYAEDRKIIGIRVFDGTEELDIGVKYLIDATGEGDVCDMAGCAMSFGRACDGSVVPFTVSQSFMINGRLSRTNQDSGKIDHRDPWVFSESILEGQRFFTHTVEGRRPLRIHPLPGLREGRLLQGEKCLSALDFLNGHRESEPVIYAYADLDKHGYDVAFDSELFKKWDLMSNLGALNITVPIPKECLLPKEYDNLAVAGRSLSVDHDLQTCVRMNRDMQKLGEVAAVMVCLALPEELPLKKVPYEPLRDRLTATECLTEENNNGFAYELKGGVKTEFSRPAVWYQDAATINRELSTLCPGQAIWSCRLLGDSIKSVLAENLTGADENLRKHSAIALAVMDDPAGLAVLRQMVQQRDRTQLQDMRKNNKLRIAMALCGLGVLKDKDSTPLLMELIEDQKEPDFYEEKAGFKEDYYRTISAAVAALMEIASACPDVKEPIAAFLWNKFSSLAYISSMCSNHANTAQYAACQGISQNINLWIKRSV